MENLEELMRAAVVALKNLRQLEAEKKPDESKLRVEAEQFHEVANKLWEHYQEKLNFLDLDQLEEQSKDRLDKYYEKRYKDIDRLLKQMDKDRSQLAEELEQIKAKHFDVRVNKLMNDDKIKPRPIW